MIWHFGALPGLSPPHWNKQPLSVIAGSGPIGQLKH